MKSTVIFLCVLWSALTLLSAAAVAEETSIWDPVVIIEMACGAEEDAYLFNLPNGEGSPFSEAQRADGSVVDCTILMWLLDYNQDPVAHFPAEDIWLESMDGGLIPCIGGTIVDADTDAAGLTTWSDPMNAGGSSQEECILLISGSSWYTSPLPLFFNSADLNGDGAVNLADVGMFSSYFFNDYDYSADFWRDGVLNLSDVGRLAQGVGGSCP